MSQEATLICVDNSDWMRNGDFIPTRLDAQSDAVNMICRAKMRQNPENTVGLMSLADTHVLATLSGDVNKVLGSLRNVRPKGKVKFISGIRIAQLALKHRQNKNQKMRIISFIGSPVEAETKELERLAKRLKKEKVSVDMVVFGEQDYNEPILCSFVDTINGKDGSNSHLVTIQPGPMLSDALASSPILRAEDGTALAPVGTGFEFGIDPSEDPELAMAIRVSLEEQRQRQEDEAKRAQQASLAGTDSQPAEQQQTEATGMDTGESVLASALSRELPSGGGITVADGPMDFDTMTEDQQMAFAIQMSLHGNQPAEMDVDETDSPPDLQEDSAEMDAEELLRDKDFLQSTLASLPGVDPNEVLQMMEQEQGEGVEEEKDSQKDKKEEDGEQK